MTRPYEPVSIARQFLFVRETLGPNRGVFVDAINRVGEAPLGSSWCMSFLSLVLWIAYQGPSPLPRTAACDVAYETAKALGYVTTTPAPGDVFFLVDPATDDAHHAGLVTATYLDRVGTIAGNTSPDGRSVDGTGVFEHDLARSPSLVFVHLP